jgi:uncharacterized damage-inducible protein DinB
MNINQPLLAEFKHELELTRKILDRVPTESFGWRPHAKSMTLGHLAGHLSDLPSWMAVTLNQAELDFSADSYTPRKFESREEVLANLEKNANSALETLEKASNETFMENWTMRNGEHIFFTLPKAVVLRNFVFNHMVHHRAQLGVYLRLLEVPIPGTYGPSADEQNM